MIAFTAFGIVLEVQIPGFSARLVAATERRLSGAASADAAWAAAGGLLGVFAGAFLVKRLYHRIWMSLASEVMQQLVIAHRPSTIRQADRILVFDAGRVVGEGRHAELMLRADGRYRRLVEMQTFEVSPSAEVAPGADAS